MASHKILLVDDEPDVRKLGELCLQKLGKFQVCLAASGPEAVRVAAHERPDLILCDVMMPGLDGPGVLALLRANPDTAEVPIIFLTACCRKEEVERFLALGAAGVIAKPFDPVKLPRLIHEHLARLVALGAA